MDKQPDKTYGLFNCLLKIAKKRKLASIVDLFRNFRDYIFYSIKFTRLKTVFQRNVKLLKNELTKPT